MKKRTTIIITLLAIMAASAVAYTQLRTPARDYLLHDFHQYTTRIQTVSLMQQDKHIDLVREGDIWWAIEGTNRTEANVLKIYQLFNMLEGLVVLEKKTDNPKHFETLGVDAAHALHVVVKDEASQVVADLMIGTFRRTGDTTVSDQAFYLRKNDDNQVWLVEGKLQTEMDINQWKKIPVEQPK